jgi:hypothetical protein
VVDAATKADLLSSKIWDLADDTGPIPPRGWLVGNMCCRQFLSSFFGAGGSGKTSLMILFALSIATGTTLTHERLYGRFRVLLLCFEDGEIELRGRLRAAMLHYGIAPDQVRGRVFVRAITEAELKLATMGPTGAMEGELVMQLNTTIARFKPDVVIFDPFIKTHRVPENDNNAMDYVATLLVAMAVKQNIAVVIGHHVPKGGVKPGDADAGRGGGALKDASRIVSTVVPMSEAEAEAFDVTIEEARTIFRVDPAKMNLTRLGGTTWYRTVGVKLNNAAGIYVDGDEIAAAEIWKPPAVMTGMTVAIVNAILDEIDAAPKDARYSDHHNAAEQAWPVIQRHVPSCAENRAKQIIRMWIDKGVLVRQSFENKDSKKRTGLCVDAVKRPRTAEEIGKEILGDA